MGKPARIIEGVDVTGRGGAGIRARGDPRPPDIRLPPGVTWNDRGKMDGLALLSRLPDNTFPVTFFDPQYRGVLDKLAYGNEGRQRGRKRSSLVQMSEGTIGRFIAAIDRVLIPSGHLFLWIDKFHLCTGFSSWLRGTRLDVVDMLTWQKGRIGMGYRTRRISEHLLIIQKRPRRAKGVWKNHSIPDVWPEDVGRHGHTHRKPVKLQGELIAAVSEEGDIVLDPAAGSFSVLEACQARGRRFLGCDLAG